MTHKRFHPWFSLAILLILGGVCAAEEIIEEAVTKPSKDRTISFIRAGLVDKVLVKDDDIVHAGEVLARLDQQAEQIQVQQLKATAEDKTEMEAEEAQLHHSRIELELKQEAHKNGVAPKLEVMQAETQVKIAEARLKIAEFKHRMNQLKYEEALVQLERMELRSPIEGIVDEIAVDEGEAVDTQMRPVMRIISIDPMWIDVNVPTRKARKYLKKDQSAEVIFEGAPASRTGKIIKVASDADSASDTVRVRIELPNPEKRGTGETVSVKFVSVSKQPTTAKKTAAPATKKKTNQPKTKE